MLTKTISIIIATLTAANFTTFAQSRIEPIPYGNFDQWVEREIKESAVLGGNTKMVYAIGPSQKIKGATAYTPKGGTPWASSNVLAIVAGVVKTSNTVFPEPRDNGRCARLETALVNCKVLGLFNISVLASGTVFLGETFEPIKNANNPYSKMDMGIAYNKKPEAIVLDYKAKVATDNKLTKATGMKVSTMPGKDYCEVVMYLQKRWEDNSGTVYAKRIGTVRYRIGKSTDGWVNAFKIPIMYGDIRNNSAYRDDMKLVPNTFYTRNSKGEITLIHENSWGDVNETPTHMIMMLSSGAQGAYVGALGNTLWVDNVKLQF